jgi:Ca2+-binding RTX toxin-like protein
MTRRTQPSSHPVPPTRASEPLEPRVMLYAVLDASGALQIDGTSTPDVINLSLAPDDARTLVVRVRSTTARFALRDVARIVIRGHSGADRIEFDPARGAIKRPAQIHAGAGNDTIIGGDGDDVMDGQEGADVMSGGAGHDTVDYSARLQNEGLDVSVDDVANDGAIGERDNVRADVEHMAGGAGNDHITAGAGSLTVHGGPGADTLRGGPADDALFGDDGADDIDGGAGNDRLDGGDKDDTIHDLLGNNLVFGCKGNDTLTTGAGNDVIVGFQNRDLIDAGDGNDTIDGGKGRDTLSGGGGDNVFVNRYNQNGAPTGDADQIRTAGSYDFVQEDGTDTVVRVGAAAPFFYDSANTPAPAPVAGRRRAVAAATTTDQPPPVIGGATLTVPGTPGTDAISVTQRGATIAVTVNGFAFNYEADRVASVVVDGAGGDDTVMLQTSMGTNPCLVPATLNGGNGNDTVVGGAGADAVNGDRGNDVLSAGAGDDTIAGGAGHDVLDGGAAGMTGDGSDDLAGGAGIDRVMYVRRTDDLTISVADERPNDGALREGDNVHSDIERVFSGSGDDTIRGTPSADFIAGGFGNDRIESAAGEDYLVGGFGRDTLVGGDDTDAFFMDEGGPDEFDALLTRSADKPNAGYEKDDRLFGDPFHDFSFASRRFLD